MRRHASWGQAMSMEPQRSTDRWPSVNHRRSAWATIEPADRARARRSMHAVVQLDVVGSARRTIRAQQRMRDDLYTLVTEIVDENDIDPELVPFDDTGDGLRLIIPFNVLRPTRVIDVFIGGLKASLREHREQVQVGARIQLRLAFDVGLVARHRHNWSGDPVVRVTRLVDAPPLREVFRTDPDVDVAALVSNAMFQTVVQHRFGQIPLACYREVRVRLKELDERGWLLVPRLQCVCGGCPDSRIERRLAHDHISDEPAKLLGRPRRA